MTDQIKKPAVHEDILELSGRMAKGIKVDSKAATAVAAEDMYKDNLPTGVTMEVVKAVSEYNTNFVAAGAHAFGQAAVDAMKANKKMDRISVDIPMGMKDQVSYTVDRLKEIPNRFGNGETIVKHGVVTTSYEVRAGKNGGQLKAVRNMISEMAATALSK